MHTFDLSTSLLEMSRNRILVITLAVWGIGQLIKIITNLLRGKRFDFRWLLGTGGMPSSHAAGVAALATACGLEYGFGSGYFALAAVFAMVTMFDAQGVRRSSGEQAEILNRLVEDMYWHKRIEMGHIRKFVGHTPIQVLVGSFLGIGLTVIFY